MPTPSQQQNPPNNDSSNSSSSSTSTGPLPTAPTNIDGGGNAPGGAPHPGQPAPDGRFGPPDTYISFALAIPINSVLAIVAGVGLGGAIVLA